MESTWERRDLPVLDAAVRYFEEHRLSTLPGAADLVPYVNMDAEEIGWAIDALNGTYLVAMQTGGGFATDGVARILPEGRRAVGQWPTAESLAERLLAAMDEAAENEPDPERRSRLKQSAAFLGSAGRDLLLNVMAAVVVKGTDLG